MEKHRKQVKDTLIKRKNSTKDLQIFYKTYAQTNRRGNKQEVKVEINIQKTTCT